MKRYQIVYSKRGYPLITWMDDAGRAYKFAEGLRKAGYSVDVWEHTETGSRKISA